MSTKYINFEDKKIKHKGAATLIRKKCISKHKCSSKLLPQKIHFRTQVHIKIAPSKNIFQNIVARCLLTYTFLKGVFKFAQKKLKKINNKDR